MKQDKYYHDCKDGKILKTQLCELCFEEKKKELETAGAEERIVK